MNQHIKVTIDGRTKTLRQWADCSGLAYTSIYYRYKNGERGRDLIRPMPKRDPYVPYTKDELYQIYWNFAGQPGELRKLADFMGCPNMEYARAMLEELRDRKRKEDEP